MPQFGFGDPISYSLMELAVNQLNRDGCVRHGAECFNYYFPQMLDDHFLVIGEAINDKGHSTVEICHNRWASKFLEAKDKGRIHFPTEPQVGVV